MPIEVRQMVIKSSVSEGEAENPSPQGPDASREMMEKMRAKILEECREMINETLRERRDR